MSQKVLFLEPVGGIAGDMFLAAALDLGVPLAELTHALSGLRLPGWRFQVTRAARHAISGTHVDVVVDEAAARGHHRGLSDIRRMIEGADTLPAGVKERALAIFQVIGVAEAKIHDVPLEQVHFHEVGAVDSIVDVCGAAVVLHLLGEPRLLSAPPPLGSGFVRAAHGNIPVPAPATYEILKDLPVRFEGVGELTTPTGAAILKALARIERPRELVVEKIGYGVGTKDFADRPNVLRAALGRVEEDNRGSVVIEANLDDCSPQLLGGLIERMLALGALDAWVAPVTMKKSRPGHLFGVLAAMEKREALISALLTETTTLGVRYHPVERFVLERRFEEVTTEYGVVRIKLGIRGGEIINANPEYEDCKQHAEAKQVSVKQVWAAAFTAYRSNKP